MSNEIFKKEAPGEIFDCAISLPMTHYPVPNMPKLGHVMLSAWEIHHIQYLAIMHCRGHRKELTIQDRKEITTLVNRYRGYANAHTNIAYLKDAKMQGIFKFMLGTTTEQFLYHNKSLGWAIQRFNRNYHILVASSSSDEAIDVDKIITNKFGLTAKEFIAVLIMIYWLCSQEPDILTAPESLYGEIDDTIFTKENIEKIVNYYTVSYDDIKESPLEHQIFYRKPFVKTKDGEVLMTNLYLIIMLLGDGLYWIARDYYTDVNKHDFTNSFGTMFESYVGELCEQYLSPNQYRQLPKGHTKGADFAIFFDNTTLLLEVKSALLALGAKQQTPNMELIDKFFANNIEKARYQLCESEKCFKGGKLVIKVIVLYENFQNSAVLQMAIRESYPDDKTLFVATVDDIENLLVLYNSDKDIAESALNKLLSQADGAFVDFNNELIEIDKLGYRHALDSINYFDMLMEELKNKLGAKASERQEE